MTDASPPSRPRWRQVVRRIIPDPAKPALYRLRRRLRRRSPAVALPERATPRPARVRLGIGPANFAGQGFAWARAVDRYLPGASGYAFCVEQSTRVFPADDVIPGRLYRLPAWQDAQEQFIQNHFTHLLVEAFRPLMGIKYGDTVEPELPVLRAIGKEIALLCHGSEIRNPRRHREQYPYSPFGQPDWELEHVLQTQSERLARILDGFQGPVFVSTPDLMDDVPQGSWLPLVVDPDLWDPSKPVLERPRPIVLHVPSNGRLKGTEFVDRAMWPLHESGLIEYQRLEDVATSTMKELISAADIVLDQFVIGSYGATAVEAMMARRVTVAHVDARVRARIPDRLPIVDATPDQLGEVVEALVADRESARKVADDGRAFVLRWHEGRASAKALSSWLGVPLAD